MADWRLLSLLSWQPLVRLLSLFLILVIKVTNQQVHDLPTSNISQIELHKLSSTLAAKVKQSIVDIDFFKLNESILIKPNVISHHSNISKSYLAITVKDLGNIELLRQRSKTINPTLPADLNLLQKGTSDLDKLFSESFTNCGFNRTLSALPFLISSPFVVSSQQYPSRAECVFEVSLSSTTSARQICLEIRHFDLETSSNCSADYLLLQTDDNRIEKLCGQQKARVHHLDSSRLILRFHTDRAVQKSGFDILVSEHDPQCLSSVRINQTNQLIKLVSPNFPLNYPDGLNCWTLVDARHLLSDEQRVNSNFSLQLETVHLEPESWCTIDFVEIYEIDFHSKSIGGSKSLSSFSQVDRPKPIPKVRFCEQGKFISYFYISNSTETKRKSPQVVRGNHVTISGAAFYLYFQSDKLVSSSGFQLFATLQTSQTSSFARLEQPGEESIRRPVNVRQWHKSCANFIADSAKKIITSPEYPNAYPPNLDCSLQIKAPREHEKIRLIAKQFVMEPDSECLFDRLELYEFEQVNATKVVCGKSGALLNFTSGSNQLKLRIVSDDFGEYPGFVLQYDFISEALFDSTNSTVKPDKRLEFETVPQSGDVRAGSSHLLHCKVRWKSSNYSDPLPKINWYKDYQPLPPDMLTVNESSLLIREFHLSSVGVYSCRVGSLVSRALLSVRSNSNERECEILFQKRPMDLNSIEGEYPIFECNAVSSRSGRLKVRWLYNGQMLQPDDRLQVLSNNYLIINSVQKQDSGFYHCVVSNLDRPDCIGEAIAYARVRAKKNVSEICGKPLLSPDQDLSDVQRGKIVGGHDALRGQFPWQVMFWDLQRNAFCGGALLNERWLATAAHCFRPNSAGTAPPPLNQIMVRLGKHDQKTKEKGEINTQVQEVHVHPQFNPSTFDNDLALVRLKDHIEFNDYIQPICLDDAELLNREFFSFFNNNQEKVASLFDSWKREKNKQIKYGHVTGWGQIRENGAQPRFLQHLKLPLVDRGRCTRSTPFKVTSNMFCAGYALDSVTDACKGDSGGPMVAWLGNRWTLLGLVSWGEGCSREGKFGFYTRIGNYVDWVKAFVQL